MESPRHLGHDETGLIVFDIDDTLLRADTSDFYIYKRTPRGIIPLTTTEYAHDPDAGDPSRKDLFDFRDFRNPTKVYQSIINGTPLLHNLRILDDYVNAGYDFCFLTARSCEDVVKRAINDFLRIRKDGDLRELGTIFNRTLSHAVNDDIRNYPGRTDAEKKANILVDLSRSVDKIVFVDDDPKNIRAAKDLSIPNMKVIKAH